MSANCPLRPNFPARNGGVERTRRLKENGEAMPVLEWASHEERKRGQVLRCNKQSRWLAAAGCVSLVGLILYFEYQTLSSFGYV
jgi:hypothetical protein